MWHRKIKKLNNFRARTKAGISSEAVGIAGFPLMTAETLRGKGANNPEHPILSCQITHLYLPVIFSPGLIPCFFPNLTANILESFKI